MMQRTWPFLTWSPTVDERRRAGLGGAVEGADDRRLDDGQLGALLGRPPAAPAGATDARRGGRRLDRRRRHDVGDHVRAAALDAQPERAVLELELGQVVRLDQVQELA